ncbi:pseudouridine synthase [Caproiciproducens galactitolivorans]|uniref:Pseudouridine synthase n=1 Tax=Caproiciproducens galactitolivorans TaxID=642589 RepID=A0ABT4BVZ7_9FIRM|nr:pseudouridine synthase [Caproiciproducens galactitolivorans]MCY1715064.1 pseudouridine synthase [Caproiciproducens galactitolivorans]
MSRERLDKILALQVTDSRRDAGVMIRRGAVTVNGNIVKKADFKVDTQSDTVTVNGEPLSVKKFVYLMMNKPAGVLSAARDTRAKTVVDLLPPELKRRGLFPAGRLDRDTEGLLIITDDGAYAHRMLAPKSNVYKYYEAVLARPVAEDDAAAFENGVVLKDRTCLPAKLEVLEEGAHPLVRVKIHEGKFHQVKRMFLARGNEVLKLKRVQIGALTLDAALAPGETREMSAEETASVFAD